MIVNLKKMDFASEKMRSWNVHDCIKHLIKCKFLNEVYLSANFTTQLLRSEITVS